MAEYVEREAMLLWLKATPLLKCNIPYQVRDGVLDLVSKQPAADVAPVRHGRWRGNYCTVCGLSWDANMCLNADDDGYFDPMPNYCPNCGARMDGGADNA